MQLRHPVLPSLCLAVALVALAAGCSKQEDVPKAVVVAKVGDTVITKVEFDHRLRERQARSPVPVDPAELLQEMVDREILVQNARKAGLQNDLEVQERVKDVLIAKLKEMRLSAALAEVTVSEAELQAAYDKDKQQFVKPEAVHLAMLHLAGETEEQLGEARRRLEAAAREAAESSADAEGFGPLAVAYSDDQESRYRGGDIGWVEKGRHPARIEADALGAGLALKERGELSQVIVGVRGCYLFKLLERRPASALPLEQVSAGLRQKLLEAKRERITADFYSELSRGLPVEIHAGHIPSLQASSREPAPPSPAIQ